MSSRQFCIMILRIDPQAAEWRREVSRHVVESHYVWTMLGSSAVVGQWPWRSSDFLLRVWWVFFSLGLHVLSKVSSATTGKNTAQIPEMNRNDTRVGWPKCN